MPSAYQSPPLGAGSAVTQAVLREATEWVTVVMFSGVREVLGRPVPSMRFPAGKKSEGAVREVTVAGVTTSVAAPAGVVRVGVIAKVRAKAR